MQDLKDVTNNVHYENFRFNRLASVTNNEGANKTKSSSNKYDHMSYLVEIQTFLFSLAEYTLSCIFVLTLSPSLLVSLKSSRWFLAE